MNEDTAIKWGSPPDSGRSRYGASAKWQSIADALRSRPGEWALVAQDVSAATGTNINKGVMAAFRPAGAFQATSRENGYAKYRVDVWARFVGESA